MSLDLQALERFRFQVLTKPYGCPIHSRILRMGGREEPFAFVVNNRTEYALAPAELSLPINLARDLFRNLFKQMSPYMARRVHRIRTGTQERIKNEPESAPRSNTAAFADHFPHLLHNHPQRQLHRQPSRHRVSSITLFTGILCGNMHRKCSKTPSSTRLTPLPRRLCD